ncbi:MAG TPA: hypothetical protein VFR24_12655 [Candidatus Angelobacter sp.]|nr:hypothetical protein [Candidatus Angelobacter sp.]
MKNPRISPTSLETTIRANSSSSTAITPFNTADKTGGAFDSALQFLKLSDDDIKQIDKLKDAIVSLAETANFVVAAITTIKAVLTLLGGLDAAKDPTQVALQAIGQRLEQIYGYLKATAVNTEYEQAANWRIDIENLGTAIEDLALSRSPSNLNDVRSRTAPLQTAVLQMLTEFGAIPFLRSTYGYTYTPPAEPSHWIDYAYGIYMSQMNGAPVAYAIPSQELQAQIWDPGYYLDVLVRAIQARISAISVTEPAFRSTGFERNDLRHIWLGLNEFISKWQASMLQTRIVGPIDPELVPGGSPGPGLPSSGPGHPVHHPYGTQNKIPMGIVDPVSGVTAFEPDYNTGFQLGYVNSAYYPTDPSGYWILLNYDDAVKTASQHQSELYSTVFQRCGIGTLYALQNTVGDLILGPLGSEFVNISPVSFRSANDSVLDQETVDLGIVGAYAGHPGQSYQGTRYVQYNTELLFSIPMARRMDVSGTQLGYKIGISVGDSAGEQIIELTPFSTGGGDPFPSSPISYQLSSDAATVYDVYQSSTFTVDEEETFQNTGQLDKSKHRLFLNPHIGQVRASVGIGFELDTANPESTFVGYANVSVTDVAPEQFKDGFIVSINVYETVIGTTIVDVENADVVMTKLADSVSLYFTPTFVVVEDSYFNDREIGLKNMRSAVNRISHAYVRQQTPLKPLNPISNVEGNTREQQSLESVLSDFRQSHPVEEAALLKRFQPQTASNVRVGRGA